MKHHDTPTSHCPSCGKKLDACTSATSDERPEPGDVTICLDCGHIMAFADDMTVRNLTDAEIVEVAGDPRIIKLQNALATLKEHAPRKPK